MEVLVWKYSMPSENLEGCQMSDIRKLMCEVIGFSRKFEEGSDGKCSRQRIILFYWRWSRRYFQFYAAAQEEKHNNTLNIGIIFL